MYYHEEIRFIVSNLKILDFFFWPSDFGVILTSPFSCLAGSGTAEECNIYWPIKRSQVS